MVQQARRWWWSTNPCAQQTGREKCSKTRKRVFNVAVRTYTRHPRHRSRPRKRGRAKNDSPRMRSCLLGCHLRGPNNEIPPVGLSSSRSQEADWEPNRRNLILGTSKMTAQQAGSHYWDLEYDSPTGGISLLGPRIWQPNRRDLSLGTLEDDSPTCGISFLGLIGGISFLGPRGWKPKTRGEPTRGLTHGTLEMRA
jgi:hypothetical protein